MALQSFFTGLLCCILFFHPSTTFYCLGRLRSHPPSNSRRRKAPSPDPPPPPPASPTHTTEEILSRQCSRLQVFSSKHKQKSKSHDKPMHGQKPAQPKNLPSFTFANPHLNDNSVCELVHGEPARHVVQRIFRAGWSTKAKSPTVEKVLKIHHSANMLRGFEEFRGTVKSLAAKTSISRREERWVVDGNELLRFHCTAIACRLVCRENSSICEQKQHCGFCNVIRYGFLSGVDKIALCKSSWRAHEMMGKGDGTSCQGETVVKRAMLVCRVIAGRVAHQQRQGLVMGEEGGFDSLMGVQRDLFVLDPKSVLPCFVVIYNAK